MADHVAILNYRDGGNQFSCSCGHTNYVEEFGIHDYILSHEYERQAYSQQEYAQDKPPVFVDDALLKTLHASGYSGPMLHTVQTEKFSYGDKVIQQVRLCDSDGGDVPFENRYIVVSVDATWVVTPCEDAPFIVSARVGSNLDTVRAVMESISLSKI